MEVEGFAEMEKLEQWIVKQIIQWQPVMLHYSPSQRYNNYTLYSYYWLNFEGLFAEPTTLPPQRPFDHALNLKPNTEPVNICSYCYLPI